MKHCPTNGRTQKNNVQDQKRESEVEKPQWKCGNLTPSKLDHSHESKHGEEEEAEDHDNMHATYRDVCDGEDVALSSFTALETRVSCGHSG